MRNSVKWFVVQLVGLIPLLVALIDDATKTNFMMALGRLLLFADRLAWFGATLSFYPIWDFILRATRGKDAKFYAGDLNFLIVALCIVTGILFVLSFAMVTLNANLTAFISGTPVLNYGYTALLIGTFVLSMSYVIRLDWLGAP